MTDAPIAPAPGQNPRATARRLVRAALCVALSGAAVPACQHYDGGTEEKQQARVAPAPLPSGPACVV